VAHRHSSPDKQILCTLSLLLRTSVRVRIDYPARTDPGPAGGLRARPAVSHISRKTSEMPRISCTQLWTGPRVRLSFKERRMKFREPTKLHRKSGVWGTRRFFAGKEKSLLIGKKEAARTHIFALRRLCTTRIISPRLSPSLALYDASQRRRRFPAPSGSGCSPFRCSRRSQR
jgi:hypothetical protein